MRAYQGEYFTMIKITLSVRNGYAHGLGKHMNRAWASAVA